MKKLFYLAGASLLCASLSACSLIFGDNDENEICDYIAVQLSNDGNWSLMAPDGTLLYEDEFKEMPSPVVNGLFTVREGDGYTVYEATEKNPTPVPNAENLKYAGVYNDGLIPVCHEGQRISVIDKKGKVKFTLNPIDGKEVMCCQTYSDGMLAFKTEEGNVGFYNTNGEVAVKPKYYYSFPFNEGYAVAGDTTNCYIINKKGEEVVKFKKDLQPMMMVFYGLVAVSEDIENGDNRCGFVNLEGEYKRLPSKATGISDYNEKILIFTDSDYKQGVMSMDDDHEVLIRAKYDKLQMIEDGKMFLAKLDDKYMILDNKGEKIQTLDCTEADYLSKKWGIVAKEGSTYSLLNTDGKSLSKVDFSAFNIYADDEVYSDYFNVQGCVKSLGLLFNGKGVGNYYIGTYPSSHLGNPEKYLYDYRFEIPEDVLPRGFRYHCTGTVYTNAPMAYRDYSAWDYVGTPRWNPDCTINNIIVTCYAGENTQKVFEGLESLLENKGYKKEKRDDGSIEFKKDGMCLSVKSNNGYALEMSLYEDHIVETDI